MNDSPRQFRAVSDNGSTSPLHGEGESSILSRSTKTVATCMNDDEFKLIHCKPEPLLALFNGLLVLAGKHGGTRKGGSQALVQFQRSPPIVGFRVIGNPISLQ